MTMTTVSGFVEIDMGDIDSEVLIEELRERGIRTDDYISEAIDAARRLGWACAAEDLRSLLLKDGILPRRLLP